MDEVKEGWIMKGWDEDAARAATEQFAEAWRGFTAAQPEFTGKIGAAWRGCYGRCGHKRLGRIVLGQSVEEACKGRVVKEAE